MKKTFVYLRGQPATGKITVAKLLEKELGWKVFWFHELKNTVYDIVKEHRIPRLMDELTAPIVRYLLERGENLVYVRPSPDKETVEAMLGVLHKYPNYKVVVICLTAEYDTLLERALSRDDPYRISSKEELDSYVNSREEVHIPDEIRIATDGKTPEEVVGEVKKVLNDD